jgi:UDP-N-acetylmuramate--alanine ligase
MYDRTLHLHFVGIGGIGMSGIATILKYQGYRISGCDADVHQKSVYDLKKIGCEIFEGNNTNQCHDNSIDILIYSSAIRQDNPELLHAQKRSIPIINRALMLAELMRTKYSVAIAGAHGKTTTTSLISHILIEAKKDPTIIIGGHLKNISANARFGASDLLVAEADESDKSLIHLQATWAVITNIDLEHLDVYKDIEDIKQTFLQFLNNLPFYGSAILCIDDPHVRSLLPLPHLKIIKYGLDPLADLHGKQINLHPDYSQFQVFSKTEQLGTIRFNMPGRHNVLNALGAIAFARQLDIPFGIIAQALETFKGVDRRFSFRGIFQGAELFDDYGHHPEEIRNTLLVARKRAKRKLIIVFQPHRYSRTQKLWEQFIAMFLASDIDHLIITDIYPASEDPIVGISSQNFIQALTQKNPHFTTQYVPLDKDFSRIKQQVSKITQQEDLVLLQGAGKINKLAELLGCPTVGIEAVQSVI